MDLDLGTQYTSRAETNFRTETDKKVKVHVAVLRNVAVLEEKLSAALDELGVRNHCITTARRGSYFDLDVRIYAEWALRQPVLPAACSSVAKRLAGSQNRHK